MRTVENALPWAMTHVDLLSERYGGQAIDCNDEFFAEANNLVKRNDPIFIDHKYTDRGKWMDGWESRRRRTPGHDWCILKLGLAGVITAVDVNTTFFRGNAPAQVSIEGCLSDSVPTGETQWQEVLEISDIDPDSHNIFEFQSSLTCNYIRLKIYPDGGVARLRVFGLPRVNWSLLLPNELVDLAASVNGGRALACSDMFFSPMNNIIAPGRGINMGDGWETRRRRGPGHDWLISKLACPGEIKRVIIDTYHFKGNYPDTFSLEATHTERDDITAEDIEWVPIIARKKLLAHTEHIFQSDILDSANEFTHVRLNIYPDGGVSRMRILGYPHASTFMSLGELNALPEAQAAEALQKCCAAAAWVNGMVERRPYENFAQLNAAAQAVWSTMGESDKLEAFSAHPQIGNVETLRAKFANTKTIAAGEQNSVREADESVLQALASSNTAYLEKFGFIFIVFASGKSAAEMLSLLQQRINNSREEELQNAAAEQLKITQLRLRKLIR